MYNNSENIIPDKNFFQKELSAEDDSPQENNIFSGASNFEFGDEPEYHEIEVGNRLNDYDSVLFEGRAYQSLSSDSIKLEHKINIKEEALAKMNSKIDSLENLGYDIQLYNLKSRRQKIKQELEDLKAEYSKLGISTKISSKLGRNKKNNRNKSKLARFIFKNILAKVSKKIGYAESIKDALDNLSKINTSVDELIQMQIPYGESINRYERLTAYLSKANTLHSRISKNMNSITRKKA